MVPSAVAAAGMESVSDARVELVLTQFRQAEVEELRTRAGDHDVAWLQVAVDDPLTMCMIERSRDFARAAQHLVSGKSTTQQPRRQRLSFEVLHHQERGVILLSHVVQGTDIRVA